MNRRTTCHSVLDQLLVLASLIAVLTVVFGWPRLRSATGPPARTTLWSTTPHVPHVGDETIVLARDLYTVTELATLIAHATGRTFDMFEVPAPDGPHWHRQSVHTSAGLTTATDLLEEVDCELGGGLFDWHESHAWIVTDDRIVLTTRQLNNQRMTSTRLYDIRHLIDRLEDGEGGLGYLLGDLLDQLTAPAIPPGAGGGFGFPGGGWSGPGAGVWAGGGGPPTSYCPSDWVTERHIELIITTVVPEEWEDNGGLAASIYALAGVLVVRAPERMHEQVERLLRHLDETARRHAR